LNIKFDDKTIRSIIDELFKRYHSPIREPIVRKFLREYGISDDEDIWHFLIKAEDLGLITLCGSPHRYGEILVVKGNIREQ